MARLQDVLLRGLAADRPAAADVAAGTLYFSTDTFATEQSDGSTWNSYSGAASAGLNQLTGDVTAGPGSGSQVATIPNDTVTNAKLANMLQERIKGRPLGSTGDPIDLDADQVSDILDTAADPFLRTSDIPPGTGITALTGEVTATGPGSAAATIANDAVTYPKMQNVSAASRLLGRGSAGGAGNVEEIQLGTNLALSGTTLNATDTGITQLTGDVTTPSGSGSQPATIAPGAINAGKIADGSITTNKIADANITTPKLADASVTTPKIADANVTTAKIADANVTTPKIADDAVTFAKIQNINASKLLGRESGSSGDAEEITLGTNLAMSGNTLNATDTGITQLTGDASAGPGNGSQNLTLTPSGVSPGSYINASVTVDAKGRVTSAANGAISPGMTQITGDVAAGPGTGSQVATLANSGVVAGAYGDSTHIPQVTVDSKGRVTAASQVALPASSFTEQVSTITGTNNNVSLSAAFTYFKWNGASDAVITGFTVGGLAPSAGSYVFIDNQSTLKKITLANESVSSTAANRFTNPEAMDEFIGPTTRVLLIYDTTTSRWRVQTLNRPQWGQGPWILDPSNGAGIARILAPDTSGTFNDYNPTGFQNCIMMEFEPAGATVTLTGLIAPSPVGCRICIIGNRDSGSGILVLKHQNAGSSANNRFRLSANVDLTLGAGQYAWFYYDPAAGRWRMLVTASVTGGITQTIINSSPVPSATYISVSPTVQGAAGSWAVGMASNLMTGTNSAYTIVVGPVDLMLRSTTNTSTTAAFNALAIGPFSGAMTWTYAILPNGTWWIRTGNVITEYRLFIGFLNGTFLTSDTAPNNSASFRFSTGVPDTNWRCITVDNAGGTNNQDSGVPVVADTSYKFQIKYNGSNIEFYINNNLVATSSSNLPLSTATVQPEVSYSKLATGTNQTRYVDVGKMLVQTGLGGYN